METLPRLEDLRVEDLDGAVEVVPDHFVDDDELAALERRLAPLVIERFADGTLLVSPPAGFISSARNVELARQIANWVHETKSGIAADSSGGVHYADGALLAADTTYVSWERWNAGDHDRTFPKIAPDATFELLSQSDRPRTTLKKALTYLRAGVRLVVLIDPYRRTVHVGRSGDTELRDLGCVERLDCSPEMPGFVLDVRAVLTIG
jgi:Uma2 family endonuclease